MNRCDTFEHHVKYISIYFAGTSASCVMQWLINNKNKIAWNRTRWIFVILLTRIASHHIFCRFYLLRQCISPNVERTRTKYAAKIYACESWREGRFIFSSSFESNFSILLWMMSLKRGARMNHLDPGQFHLFFCFEPTISDDIKESREKYKMQIYENWDIVSEFSRNPNTDVVDALPPCFLASFLFRQAQKLR